MTKLGVGGRYYLDQQALIAAVRWSGTAAPWVRVLAFCVDNQDQMCRPVGLTRRPPADNSVLYEMDLTALAASPTAAAVYVAVYLPPNRVPAADLTQLAALEWRFLRGVKVILVATVPPALYPMRAMLLGRLLRADDQWRVEVLAEGLTDGLTALSRRFGVDLNQLPKEPPVEVTAPPVSTTRRALVPPTRNHELRNQWLAAGAVAVMAYVAWPRANEPAQVHYAYPTAIACAQVWGDGNCLNKQGFSYSPLREAHLAPPSPAHRNGQVVRHCYQIPERCFSDWGAANCAAFAQETCYRHGVVTPGTVPTVGGGGGVGGLGGLSGLSRYTADWERRPGVNVRAVGPAVSHVGSTATRPLVVQRGGFGSTARSGFSLG